MFPTRYENTDPTLIWLKRYWTLCQDKHELNEKDAYFLARFFNPIVHAHQLKRLVTVSCLLLLTEKLYKNNCLNITLDSLEFKFVY